MRTFNSSVLFGARGQHARLLKKKEGLFAGQIYLPLMHGQRIKASQWWHVI